MSLHWLACNNDVSSIKYLLGLIKPGDTKLIEHVMCLSHDGMSALDLAAKNRSDAAAKEIIKFFTDNFEYVRKVFLPSADHASSTKVGAAGGKEKKPWVVRIFNSKDLTPVQRSFLPLYYWAAYYNMQETVDLFLGQLGISPFVKIHQG